MTQAKFSPFKNFKDDIPASIVVFLVAMPLCLGIALASGAPLFSGIIAGMVGGIVIPLFSKSSLGVSGPAAGLAVIVLAAIQDLGAYDTFLLAVVLAGVIQLVFGLFRAGIIAYYFPSSVIKGMLSGIGIIIVLKQIPHAFGFDADPEGDWAFFQYDGRNTFSELVYMLDFISPGATIVAAISFLILLLWERPFMKKNKIFHWIQGPLVAVTAGILLNLAFQGSESLRISKEHLVNIPVSDSITGFFGQFAFPNFSQITNPEVWIIALTIAVVASLETLLCVEATDKLDPYKRITPTNAELRAQGIANFVSGLIGGLPITQVIVRSSANIQSGGKTKASAFFHGILLLVCVISIPVVINMIPLASLAAILFVVGYKLAKPALFKEMWAKGRVQFVPFIITILGIVFTDLLVGITLGLVIGIFYILYENYKTPYHFDPSEYIEDGVIHFRLSENVTFLNKAKIINTLRKIPENTRVILDGSRTRSIDPDVLEHIHDYEENAKLNGIELELRNIADGNHQDNPKREFNEFIQLSISDEMKAKRQAAQDKKGDKDLVNS